MGEDLAVCKSVTSVCLSKVIALQCTRFCAVRQETIEVDRIT